MPRTLLTGATGFVGSNLAAHLCQHGWEVRCLVREMSRAAKLERLGAELALGSLADKESIGAAVAGVDVVFHVAGRIRALNEKQFFDDNVQGTRHVVEACAEQPTPPVVVMVSSIAAGGPSKPGRPQCEADDDRPVSAYGRSKLEAERAAAALAGEVPISVVRPPIIFGPADTASLAIFRGVQLARFHPVPGWKAFPVSLVYVADLCDALVRIAERGVRMPCPTNGAADPSAGSYYVAAERTVKYRELGGLAAQALNCRVLAPRVPMPLFWLVGGAAEVMGQIRRRPGVLNLDKIREAAAPGWECSDEKLRQELGYRPGGSLEQQFSETAAWYREQGWLR